MIFNFYALRILDVLLLARTRQSICAFGDNGSACEHATEVVLEVSMLVGSRILSKHKLRCTHEDWNLDRKKTCMRSLKVRTPQSLTPKGK